jgi:hypothetical protein
MQGMTGANDKIRLVMTIIPKGFYLANSCNYILPQEDIDLYALLAILNSKLINWFFRCFSTNSNVNGYEVDNFPIPKLNSTISNVLKDLCKSALNTDKGTISHISTTIDVVVYKLYDFSYDEVLIVDPETTITRDEYENYKLD